MLFELRPGGGSAEQTELFVRTYRRPGESIDDDTTNQRCTLTYTPVRFTRNDGDPSYHEHAFLPSCTTRGRRRLLLWDINMCQRDVVPSANQVAKSSLCKQDQSGDMMTTSLQHQHNHVTTVCPIRGLSPQTDRAAQIHSSIKIKHG